MLWTKVRVVLCQANLRRYAQPLIEWPGPGNPPVFQMGIFLRDDQGRLTAGVYGFAWAGCCPWVKASDRTSLQNLSPHPKDRLRYRRRLSGVRLSRNNAFLNRRLTLVPRAARAASENSVDESSTSRWRRSP